MAIPTENTLALTPPRRPTQDDFGGVAKEDDSLFPPNPITMPTAADYNERCRMLAAAWRLLPVACLPITFIAGAPTKGTPQAGNPNIVTGTFTVTDNGAGDTTITWPADTFPAATRPPQAEVDDPAHGSWLHPTCEPVTNGVRVKTRNSAGALADVGFTLVIY
jgi:hypothetical protein